MNVLPFILVAVAAQRVGVTRVGDVQNTSDPLHVSSVITPASSLDVVLANAESLLAVSAIVQERSGSVHVRAAVIALVNNQVKVFATLRSQNVASRNVFNAELVCAEARTISHDHPATNSSAVSQALTRTIFNACHT